MFSFISFLATYTPAIEISDEMIPLAFENTWAFGNMLMAIATMLLSVCFFFDREDRDEDGNVVFKAEVPIWLKLVSIIIGLVTVIFFIMSEDLSKGMVMLDRWSSVMVALLLMQLCFLFVAKKKLASYEFKVQ